MNFMQVMGIVAGILQFVVAAYALRLNRLFGAARVGWSLFSAFLLMAFLHLLQLMMPFGAGARPGIEIEVIYTLVSMLLLTGLVHIEIVLKERSRMELEEQNLRAELESEVKRKTAHLTRVIGELQMEIDERRQIEMEVGRTHKELRRSKPDREEEESQQYAV